MILDKIHPVLEQIAAFQQEAPVDVVRIAEEQCGINVWEDELEPGVSGKLFLDSENGGNLF